MSVGATIHRCISLVISLFSYPESVSQEVDRERRMTPGTERKLQGMTVNLQGVNNDNNINSLSQTSLDETCILLHICCRYITHA